MGNSNRIKKYRPVVLFIVLAAVFGLGGWHIEVQRAQQRCTLSGFFESQPTQVSSRVGGRVSHILVNEGDVVHKDQPLIELDAAPNQDETLAKEAAAEQARQQLHEVENGPRPEDIARQEAAVAEAEADLARLRSGSRPQEIAQARAGELNARARLAQAKRGLTAEERAQAKARLDDAAALEDFARRDAGRLRELFKQGAISQQQLDQSQSNLQQATAKRQEMEEAWLRAKEGTPPEELEEARQSYKQAKAALDLVLAGARKEDISAAEARLQQAQAAMAELRAGSRKEEVAQARAAAESAEAMARSSQANLVERTVRAPEDGVVERTLVAAGDLASPGTALLRLDNPKDIWVRVYIPEAQLAHVTVGNSAALRVDGIDEPVSAYVESVAARGEFTPANLQTPNERGKQVFAVRLRLRHAEASVKAGMYATVTRIGKWQP